MSSGKTIFLSYYEPFAGLCNQLYLITNHIHSAFLQGKKIYIHKFNIDIFKKTRVEASQIIDIEATNQNLEKILGTGTLETRMPEIIQDIPTLCIYPVSSIPILNCLQFNPTILDNVKKIKSNFPSGYYSIHFRLDVDCIIHYCFGKKVYSHFMELANTLSSVEYFKKLDIDKMTNYCRFLMNQYFEFLVKAGFDKTWYISTSITKDPIHQPMEKYLQQLITFIKNSGGRYYIPDKIYPERECNALVDLLILRDSTKLIGFEGSSFSEGYCFKVNSIRNVIKESFFVKEYQQ